MARWWRYEENGRVRCTLCPRECKLKDGQSGFCAARENRGNSLFTKVYGKFSSVGVDPIEKKPLFHFLPGSGVLSLGTVGCTMGCVFCQNWTISRSQPGQLRTKSISPEKVVECARADGCASIAFTYNEPTVFGEYVVDAARCARESGLKSVLVTNGYVHPQAMDELYENIDGANVDLKALDPYFYKKRTLSRLEPVLDLLKHLREKRRVWLEITNLIIPGWNDAPERIDALCRWVLDHLGSDVPLHFSAFHPTHKALDLPCTAEVTVFRACQQAKELGIQFVYAGNVPTSSSSDTCCPSCGKLLIQRGLYRVQLQPDFEGGTCSCGEAIPGVFGAPQ